MDMNERDICWQRFTQSGDPKQYLAYKRATDDTPRPRHNPKAKKPTAVPEA